MILSYRFVFYFSFSLKSGNLSVNLDNLVLDQRTTLIYNLVFILITCQLGAVLIL